MSDSVRQGAFPVGASPPPRRAFTLTIYVVFLLSGAAAVIYQLIWQRVLLGMYGSSIEAVTVVVTSFMLGLGFGSLAGGWLADRPRVNVPLWFAWVELTIGLFGLVSIPTFHWVGRLTATARIEMVWALALLLLLVPTMLMGATLPLLTAYLNRRLRNVGASVGNLYAVNTLGSAAGAVVAVLFIVGSLGQQGSVLVAVGLNLVVAASVVVVARNDKDS
ncbi:MAG: fused MFS/spermidine synthase [Vicinamibacterales bacterium]